MRPGRPVSGAIAPLPRRGTVSPGTRSARSSGSPRPSTPPAVPARWARSPRPAGTQMSMAWDHCTQVSAEVPAQTTWRHPKVSTLIATRASSATWSRVRRRWWCRGPGGTDPTAGVRPDIRHAGGDAGPPHDRGALVVSRASVPGPARHLVEGTVRVGRLRLSVQHLAIVVIAGIADSGSASSSRASLRCAERGGRPGTNHVGGCELVCQGRRLGTSAQSRSGWVQAGLDDVRLDVAVGQPPGRLCDGEHLVEC